MVNRLLEQICARQIWPIIIIAFFKELNWSSFTFLKMMMMTNVRSCFGWKFQLSIETNWITFIHRHSDKDSHLHNFGERRPKVGVTSMSAMLPLLHCRADRSTRVKSRLRAPVTLVKSKLRQNRAQHPGLEALTTAPKALTPVLLQLSNFLRNFRFCFGNRIKAFPAVWTEKPWGNRCLTIV